MNCACVRDLPDDDSASILESHFILYNCWWQLARILFFNSTEGLCKIYEVLIRFNWLLLICSCWQLQRSPQKKPVGLIRQHKYQLPYHHTIDVLTTSSIFLLFPLKYKAGRLSSYLRISIGVSTINMHRNLLCKRLLTSAGHSRQDMDLSGSRTVREQSANSQYFVGPIKPRQSHGSLASNNTARDDFFGDH